VLNVTLERPCTALDFELDGVMVAVGTTNGRVLVYDVRNIKAPLHDFQVNVLAIGTVLRIRDVYPGSEFFPSRVRIFSIPDPGSASKNLSILPKNVL
jgi:hypothetical protein